MKATYAITFFIVAWLGLGCKEDREPFMPVLCIEVVTTQSNVLITSLEIEVTSKTDNKLVYSGGVAPEPTCFSAPYGEELSVKFSGTLGCKDFLFQKDMTALTADSFVTIELEDALFEDFNEIKGTLLTCENLPLLKGWVELRSADRIITTSELTNGAFTIKINACISNEFSLTAYDLNRGKVSNTIELPVNRTGVTSVEPIVVCTNFPPKVYTGSIYFQNQKQLDDFGRQHYTKIEGSVLIEGCISLVPLISVSEITGNLRMGKVEAINHYKDLTGLAGLKKIGGNLEIYYSDKLINIDDLSGLQSIGGSLKIGSEFLNGPFNLTNIKGLRNVTTIGGNIEFWRVSFSIVDLDNLNSIGGDLYISGGNPKNLNGLSALRRIGGKIWFEYSGIEDISGLSGLTEFEGPLSFYYPSSLKSIDLPWNNFNGKISISGRHIIESIKFPNVKNLNQLFLSGAYFDGTRKKNETLKTIEFNNLLSINALAIESHQMLTELSGFPSLATVGSVSLVENTYLAHLPAFNRVTNLTGRLELAGLPLANLSDFASLNSVGQDLTIRGNSQLTDLNGLSNLISVGKSPISGNSINIQGNPLLATFCGLQNAIFSGNYVVSGNAYNPTADQLKTSECKQ